MTLKRRNFLLFMGASAGTLFLGSGYKKFSMPFAEKSSSGLSFKPVKVPMPLDNTLAKAEQIAAYSTYEVSDDLVLPEGFTYDVIGAWGDRLGESRFGYNNDYLSFVETAPNEGFLTINFEYISGKTWLNTYEMVIGESLPIEAVKAALPEGTIDVFTASNSNLPLAQIQKIAKEALIDQGIGIISLRRRDDGRWERTFSKADRRITGLSGFEDGRYLQATGPAVAVFDKANKQGYDDRLGSRIIGTFANCAGGTTPWGTVFSAEENYQAQVPEPVMADGSSLAPSQTPFALSDEDIEGQGNVFGLAGNKYGWMVEVDPSNSEDWGTKHTWLGRFRHEAVALRVVRDQKLAVYSGCDRRGGHLYKFLSQEAVRRVDDKANSRLMEQGMLYGAQFNPDGTGRWVALAPSTTVNPVLPSQVLGEDNRGIVTLPNPDRSQGGMIEVTSDAQIAAFKQQFSTLGDLYEGNFLEKQGAILIDAHFAANAAGITCTARPEDTQIAQDGSLYIAFTSGTPGSDGGPDRQIFQGPQGETPYEFGWIMRLLEAEPDAMDFRWEMLALGGEPAAGGAGFANPDNLETDRNGNLWMVTDISTSSHNQAVPSRVVDGQPVSQKDLLGLFGNNTTWFIPTSGPQAGNAYPFAIAPMETETCGLCLTPDEQTLFLAIQHPGEASGMRQDQAAEMRSFALRTAAGQEFTQQRKVPIGSNWPGKGTNDPPRPAVVAVRRV